MKATSDGAVRWAEQSADGRLLETDDGMVEGMSGRRRPQKKWIKFMNDLLMVRGFSWMGG